MSIRRNAQRAEAVFFSGDKSAGPASSKVSAAPKPSASPKSSRDRSVPAPSKDYTTYREIFWDLISITSNLEDMRRHWAKKFGVTGPQWAIMLAINDMDKGGGVPVGEVSAKIHAVSTFVTTQTKLLEQRGLLTRVSSTADARVVLMSLSDRARKEIARYFGQWGDLHSFIFADFDAAALRDIKQKLEFLKRRTDIASRRTAADDF